MRADQLEQRGYYWYFEPFVAKDPDILEYDGVCFYSMGSVMCTDPRDLPGQFIGPIAYPNRSET